MRLGRGRRPLRAGGASTYIVIHYFLTNLGYFGLLSTLVVTLNAAGFEAPEIALLVMVFTITSKVAKIPLASLLDRIAAATSVLLGCVIAAAGFVGLSVTGGLPLTAGCLAIAGMGISINALASKQLAAAASDGSKSRAPLFSLINTAVNIASAVAAPVALMLTEHRHYGYVLIGVAAVYSTAGVATFVNYSSLGTDRQPTSGCSLRAYLVILHLPGMRCFLLINSFGWLMYGQLFNVLALYVSRTLGLPGRLGWLYTLNALLIVFLQLGMTRLTERWTAGRQIITVVTAYGTFTLSFAAAYVLPGYGGAVVFVIVFTLAEMMFIPSVDVLLLGLLGRQSRAVGYSILSISNALGEALGGGAGVATYRWLSDHAHENEYWLLTTALALMFTGLTYALRGAGADLRSEPPRAARRPRNRGGRHRSPRPNRRADVCAGRHRAGIRPSRSKLSISSFR